MLTEDEEMYGYDTTPRQIVVSNFIQGVQRARGLRVLSGHELEATATEWDTALVAITSPEFEARGPGSLFEALARSVTDGSHNPVSVGQTHQTWLNILGHAHDAERQRRERVAHEAAFHRKPVEDETYGDSALMAFLAENNVGAPQLAALRELY